MKDLWGRTVWAAVWKSGVETMRERWGSWLLLSLSLVVDEEEEDDDCAGVVASCVLGLRRWPSVLGSMDPRCAEGGRSLT